MIKVKKSKTKEKIKASAIKLFNENETLSITTNHIAKDAGISPGNLYYHYKNKEEIIREIYSNMSTNYESFNSFRNIKDSSNPLETLSFMFDKLGDLFWEYRFLIRDSALLMALDVELKKHFVSNQEKRIQQIEGLLNFLIKEDILIPLPKEEVKLRAKVNWFISAYWQVFSSTMGEITKESIKEGKDILFTLHIFPFLTTKGKQLLENFTVSKQ